MGHRGRSRALDCSFAARPFGVDFLLHGVFEENVEEQRPFAVEAHLNKPGLEGVIFGVGQVVPPHDVVGGGNHL